MIWYGLASTSPILTSLRFCSSSATDYAPTLSTLWGRAGEIMPPAQCHSGDWGHCYPCERNGLLVRRLDFGCPLFVVRGLFVFVLNSSESPFPSVGRETMRQVVLRQHPRSGRWFGLTVRPLTWQKYLLLSDWQIGRLHGPTRGCGPWKRAIGYSAALL